MPITVTQKEKYLKHPFKCPYCGGNVEADAAPNVDEGGQASQKVGCLECEKQWFDIYKLVDIQEEIEET